MLERDFTLAFCRDEIDEHGGYSSGEDEENSYDEETLYNPEARKREKAKRNLLLILLSMSKGKLESTMAASSVNESLVDESTIRTIDPY